MPVGPVFIGVAISIVVILVFLVAIPYYLSSRRNRRTGQSGFVQRSRLACPKCHQMFDYEWIPGAALTAVRLGSSRYMACPLCGKWSMFDVARAPAPPPG